MNGKFFNIKNDPLEINDIQILTKNQNIIKSRLKKELEKIPDLEENSKHLWEKQRINTFQ